MTDKLRLTLGELESLAHHDMGYKSKDDLLEYIGWMWCLLQDLDPDFKDELIRDYAYYIRAKCRTKRKGKDENNA